MCDARIHSLGPPATWNIRCYNAQAVGGDLRATVDRTLEGDTKSSMMAGLQYTSFGEYLAGDTKGAL